MSCSECFTGAIMSDYKPKGTLTTLHSLTCYIARPTSSPKGIITIIPDAFGLPFPNNKHLADTYASHGYLTYLPDFMNGSAAPAWMVETFPAIMRTATWWDIFTKPYHIACAVYGLIPFMLRNSFGKSMPLVKSFLEDVRKENPTLPIGAAGFCWGGQHTVTFAHGLRSSTGKFYTDAGFTAHPSNLSMPDDIKKVTRPLSIAQATEDIIFTMKQAREAEAIFRQKQEKDGLKHLEIKYYEGAGHGFGVRADPNDKEVVKHAEASVLQAVEFFERVFSEWKPS